MATGDILSVTITDKTTAGQSTDGWYADVVVDGLNVGGTYAFGLGTNNADLASAKFVMTVVSEGYNSAGTLGTVTRTVYGTRVMRKPYPDHATLYETAGGGNVTLRIALSDFVYDDDNTGAGKSGTAPTVSIGAGWYTQGGTPSNACTALAVTNNSTLDYPKAFGQWAMPPYQRFTSDPTLRFTARHRFGIARVLFTLTDAGAHTATAAATAETARLRAGSGLYATEHAAIVSLSALDQNSALTARAQVYPLVGDADSIMDTNAQTANDDNRALGQCDYPFFCDKSNALTVTKYVATTGNDSTGNGSSGTPWLTIGKALTEGSGNDIELAAGTYDLLGTSVTAPSSLGYWRVVRPASGASVILNIGATKAYNTPHLKFQGCTVNKTAADCWIDGGTGARYIWFDSCAFDQNGNTGATTVSLFAYRSAVAILTDCSVNNAVAFGMGSDFVARIVHWLDGNSLIAASAHRIMTANRLTANATENISFATKEAGATTGPQQDPMLCEFNKFMKMSSTSAPVLYFYSGSVACVNGISCIGNVIEKTGATSAAVQIAADSGASNVAHCLIWHNTLVGPDHTAGRINCCYNNTGSTAWLRLNWSIKYNSGDQFNIKSDTFETPNAARTGNWAVLNGVGVQGNRWEDALFPGDYAGLDTTYTATPAYVSDLAGSTGGGDYTPDTGSELINRVPSGGAVMLFDLLGTAKSNAGFGEAGVIEILDPLGNPWYYYAQIGA